MINVHVICSEVEKFGTSMTPPAGPMNLGNSSMLTLDPVLDKTPLFSQLYEAYKLDSKVRIEVKLCILLSPVEALYTCTGI